MLGLLRLTQIANSAQIALLLIVTIIIIIIIIGKIVLNCPLVHYFL